MPPKIVALNNTRRDTGTFVRFAAHVYRDDPYWASPLIREQIQYLHNGPLTSSVEKQLFMAYRNDVPVSRLCVHRNFAYNEHYQTNQGFFGYFESLDDQEANHLILQAGEQWLKNKGCHEMLGPIGFSLYEGAGVLIEGADDPPVVQCPYNPLYYIDLMHQVGFQKAIDWYAYHFDHTHVFPDVVARIHDRLIKKAHLTFRHNDPKRWSENIALIRTLFNEAWADNWGHIPIDETQWRHLTDSMKPALVGPLSWIMFANDKPAGFMITIKDMNDALRPAKGRLLPFGWLRILRETSRIKRIRVLAMGVAKAYRNRGYDLMMTAEVIKQAVALGYETCDCSLIVESNRALIDGLDTLNGRRYKTFRIYRKQIAQTPVT